MKLSLPPKLVEKLVWVPVISFFDFNITFDSNKTFDFRVLNIFEPLVSSKVLIFRILF
jgi:hypothetical protein